METAGVLYHRLDYPVLAEMMQLLLTDQALRGGLSPDSAGGWRILPPSVSN
jgi:hypothetical protein